MTLGGKGRQTDRRRGPVAEGVPVAEGGIGRRMGRPQITTGHREISNKRENDRRGQVGFETMRVNPSADTADFSGSKGPTRKWRVPGLLLSTATTGIILTVMVTVIMECLFILGLAEQAIARSQYLREKGDSTQRGLAAFLKPFEGRLPIFWTVASHFAMDLGFILMAIPAPRMKVDRQIVFLGKSGFNRGVKKAIVVGGVRAFFDFLVVLSTTSRFSVLAAINILATTSLPANVIASLIFPAVDGPLKVKMRAAIKMGIGAWASNVVAAAAYWLTLSFASNDDDFYLMILKGAGCAVVKLLAHGITLYFFTASRKAVKESIIAFKRRHETPFPPHPPVVYIQPLLQSGTWPIDPEESYDLGHSAVPTVISNFLYMATWFVLITGKLRTFYVYLALNIACYVAFKAWMHRGGKRKAILKDLKRAHRKEKEAGESVSRVERIARSILSLQPGDEAVVGRKVDDTRLRSLRNVVGMSSETKFEAAAENDGRNLHLLTPVTDLTNREASSKRSSQAVVPLLFPPEYTNNNALERPSATSQRIPRDQIFNQQRRLTKRPSQSTYTVSNPELYSFLVTEASQTIGELLGIYTSILLVCLIGTLILSQDALFQPDDYGRCSHGLTKRDYFERSSIIVAAHLGADVLMIWGSGIPFDRAVDVRLPLETLFGVSLVGCTNACMIVAAFRGGASEVQAGVLPCLPKPFELW
ncbi:hypothetical protein HDU67_003233 [Dinochytrium kinnereticum]|nr:hypothetical protein HDU67_003233 [Dinochytrium kinnereticum]